MKIALQVVAIAVLWASGATIVAAQEAPPTPPPMHTTPEPIFYFAAGSDIYIRPNGPDVVQRLAYLFPPSDVPHFFVVRGQTDTAGSDEYNMDLSRRRAMGVADRLVEAGARPDRIFINACGEALLNRPTPNDRAEPLNRFARFDLRVGRMEPGPPLPGCDQTPFQAGQGPR